MVLAEIRDVQHWLNDSDAKQASGLGTSYSQLFFENSTSLGSISAVLPVNKPFFEMEVPDSQYALETLDRTC